MSDERDERNERDEREERGFTVVDRRGREESERPEPPAAESGPGAGAPRASADDLPRIDFSTFVLSLATSALYHLGLVEDPGTGERVEPNLPLARQTVDTLELLQEKTRGNLDEDEVKLLQSLLTELRMRCVEATREP